MKGMKGILAKLSSYPQALLSDDRVFQIRSSVDSSTVQTVKQMILSEAKNGKRDWEETPPRLSASTLMLRQTDFEKKSTMGNNLRRWAII